MKVRNLRWWIIGTCFLATSINYLDRQVLSVAAPTICKEFGFTNSDYSSIVTYFLVAYSVMQCISGKMIDTVGTRLGMTLSVAWWSIAAALHALGVGLWSFRIFRFLLGLGEAGAWPASTKVVSEWFPAAQRSLAVAIFDSGSSLGGILAPPLVTWITLHFGWRMAFLGTGLLGAFWLWLWLSIYQKPDHHPRITTQELDLILKGRSGRQDNGQSATPWSRLLGYAEVWGMILGRLLTDCVWWFYVYWLPKYLSDERGMTMGQIALLAWIPFFTVDVGNIASGWFSGHLISRSWSLNTSRKLVMAIGAVSMAAGLPAGLTSNATLSLVLIAVATFGYACWGTMMLTLPSDLFPSSTVAAVSGLSGTGAGIGGILFTWVTGHIVDQASYKPVFAAAGILPLIALAVVNLLIPQIRRLEYPKTVSAGVGVDRRL